jgi:hypothetical protein
MITGCSFESHYVIAPDIYEPEAWGGMEMYEMWRDTEVCQ